LEFYETLLGFVNYRLYHSLGLIYPPNLDNDILEKIDKDQEMSEFSTSDTEKSKNLFSDFHFFLNREVPRKSLYFVIRSFGGKISWDIEETGEPSKEGNDYITHHIADRPSLDKIYLNREYIQPQWVYDCINNGILLPVEEYKLGAILPPHLSPFIDSSEGHIPDRRKQLDKIILEKNRKNTNTHSTLY